MKGGGCRIYILWEGVLGCFRQYGLPLGETLSFFHEGPPSAGMAPSLANTGNHSWACGRRSSLLRLPRSASEPLLQWRIIVPPYPIGLGLGLAHILGTIITIELCTSMISCTSSPGGRLRHDTQRAYEALKETILAPPFGIRTQLDKGDYLACLAPTYCVDIWHRYSK